MMTKYVLLLTLLVPAPSPCEDYVRQGFLNAGKLYEMLDKDLAGGTLYEDGIGFGYVLGVYDRHYGTLHCLTEDAEVTAIQVRQIVYNYLKDHPEKWGASAEKVVVLSLDTAFPCASSASGHGG